MWYWHSQPLTLGSRERPHIKKPSGIRPWLLMCLLIWLTENAIWCHRHDIITKYNLYLGVSTKYQTDRWSRGEVWCQGCGVSKCKSINQIKIKKNHMNEQPLIHFLANTQFLQYWTIRLIKIHQDNSTSTQLLWTSIMHQGEIISWYLSQWISAVDW